MTDYSKLHENMDVKEIETIADIYTKMIERGPYLNPEQIAFQNSLIDVMEEYIKVQKQLLLDQIERLKNEKKFRNNYF